jgi:hypothetical protein
LKYILLLILTLNTTYANEKLTTSKTSCIQQSVYPTKTLAEQKKILVEQAKQESLEELYGTLISSSTDIQDGKLISDKIKSRAVGAVRVDGNPSFYNGKNLGEICTDVHVYITKKDLEKYQPKKVSLQHFCFNDPKVSMQDIKQKAKYSAYKEIVSQYKPSLKLSGKEAEQYIHRFTISNDNFDFDTASYCFNAVGTVLPYEFEMAVNTKKISEKITDKKNKIVQLGIWNTSWKKMILYKQGKKVYGKYQDDGGEIFNAKFNSKNVLKGYWIENNSDHPCNIKKNGRKAWGKFIIRFDDFKSFRAEWGYCNNDFYRTDWTGDKID